MINLDESAKKLAASFQQLEGEFNTFIREMTLSDVDDGLAFKESRTLFLASKEEFETTAGNILDLE